VPEYQLQEGLYEYSSELCIYLRQLEERFVLHKDFLEGGSINQGMRAMVVNWIIEVRQFSGRQQVEPCPADPASFKSVLQSKTVAHEYQSFKFAKLFVLWSDVWVEHSYPGNALHLHPYFSLV
jgi:hypothetical protein